MHNMNWFRKKQKTIIIFICAILMVVFVGGTAFIKGMANKRTGKSRMALNRMVPGAEIKSMADAIAKTSQQRRMTSEQVKREAWRTILFTEAAKEFGITVTPKEIQDALKYSHSTEDGEGFDQSKYQNYLSRIKLASKDYEQLIKTSLASYAAENVVRQSVTMDKEEAWLWYSMMKEQAVARYLQITAKELEPYITISQEPGKDQARQFYDKFKQYPSQDGMPGYLAPETIRIEYLLMPTDNLEKSIKVTEDEIKAYYEKNKASDYTEPEPEKKTDDKKPAADAKKEEDAKADATEVKEKADETKKPEDKKPEPKYTPLADVRKEIETKLRKDAAEKKANEIINEIAEIAEEDMTGNVDLQKIQRDFAREQKIALEFKQTAKFTYDEAGTKVLPGAHALRGKAFGQGGHVLDKVRPKVSCARGPLLYKIIAASPPQPMKYEDAKKQVLSDLRTDEARKKAASITTDAVKGNATDFAEATKAVETLLEKLVADSGIALPKGKTIRSLFVIGVTKPFSRPRQEQANPYAWQQQPRIIAKVPGMPGEIPGAPAQLQRDYPAFSNAALRLNNGQVSSAAEGKPHYTAYLIERIKTFGPKRADFDKEAEKMITTYQYAKERAILDAWRLDIYTRSAQIR
jgi:SurA-like N-terminal domain